MRKGFAMRLDKLTIKATEALQTAERIARDNGQIGRASCRERVYVLV